MYTTASIGIARLAMAVATSTRTDHPPRSLRFLIGFLER
jgi:hypothetical protein